MREEVLRRLDELRRRYRWVRAMDAFLELAFVLSAGVAALLLIDRLAFELGLSGAHIGSPLGIVLIFAAALAVAALGGVIAGTARRVTAAAIAWRADRALAMEERFLTSVELAADGARSAFAPALFTQAAEAMRGLDVRRVFPPSPVGYRWGILLALVAGAVLAAFAPRVEAPPFADFAFIPERGPAPLTASFEDASQGRISRFDWDFGDGAISSLRNPAHRFERPGRYTVRLTVRGPGGVSEKAAEIEAVDPALPVAAFDTDPGRGRAPLNVRFTNRSHRAEQCYWMFGDGATSTERNPVHTFTTPGLYDVVLDALNAMGRSTKTRRIKVIGVDAPLADFRALPHRGPAPLLVNFEDNSTGAITEWEWDTGDPIASKEERTRRDRMISHTYRMPGKYTVRLKVKGPGGEDALTREHYIEVEDESSGAAKGGGGGGGGGGKGGGGGMSGRGGGAGTEEGRLFGDEAQRPKVEFTPETVQAQPRPGELVEKVKNIYGKGAQGDRGQDRPYDTQTFGEYQRAAEDAMNREHIPPSLRDYVKRYFEEIRPK